jgi:hypothetical protein
MDRCDLSLSEGELIVLRMLVNGHVPSGLDVAPANRLRALNTLRRKVARATLRRVPTLRLVEVQKGKSS